jgi:alpha-tubulin suppressor-like RCC1 family protein
MPLIIPGVQYSGIWTLQQAHDAKAAGTWPGPGIWVWGSNSSGQLGLGNTTAYSSPKQVGSLKVWSTIASGAYHMMAIKGGELWSWGYGANGRLGIGNATDYSSPKQIGSLTDWYTIAGGGEHSLAIKTDGTMWGWGNGTDGRVGNGTASATINSPVQIGALTTWSKISGGAYHSMAIKTDGTMWTWGFNSQGQLGDGSITSRSSPVQIGVLTTWSKVAGGSQHTLAIKTDGTLWSWGYNNLGQLGGGSTRSSPVQVGALTNWLDIAAGAYYNSFAIKTDGTLWAWGYNNEGQLGNGTTNNEISPIQIGALTTWSQIAGGNGSGGYAKAITTQGYLYMWGGNSSGQLGLGSTTSYSSPKQVGSLASWSKITSGYSTLTILMN